MALQPKVSKQYINGMIHARHRLAISSEGGGYGLNVSVWIEAMEQLCNNKGYC
jgi:hypothetical protein